MGISISRLSTGILYRAYVNDVFCFVYATIVLFVLYNTGDSFLEFRKFIIHCSCDDGESFNLQFLL